MQGLHGITIRPMRARDPSEAHRAATQLELFFDLVCVIAVAAVTAAFHHAISEGHGAGMLVNYVFLFVAIWWAWMNYTWFASAFDNDDALFRGLTMVIMGGYLLFAGGVAQIFEHLDFGYGLAGWIVMRVGMIGLWLRAAAAGEHRRAALRYAGGLAVAQVFWTALYFSVPPASALFLAAGAAIFAVEFLVPVWAEVGHETPWHRHHMIERYGLLNVIVLGEVLLSVSLICAAFYDDQGIDPELLAVAVAGLVTVFVLWWLYFIEADHLNSTRFGRALLWGYGHVFVFGAGAAVGSGLAAYLDAMTHHSHLGRAAAAAYVNLPVAVYLLALWAIRDVWAAIGWRRLVLLAAGFGFAALAWAGAPPEITAVLAVTTLTLRFRVGEARPA